MNKFINIIANNRKRLINILIYFVGILALRGASIILTPLYTRVFTTSDYGSIELANSLVSFLSTIMGLGLCQYIGIEYFHFKDDRRRIAVAKNIKTYLYLATPASIIIIILILFYNGSFQSLDKRMLVLTVIVSYLSYFSNLCLMLCKNQKKTTTMTLLQLSVGLIGLFINLFGVCIFGWGVYSTLIASSLSYLFLLFALPRIYPLNKSGFTEKIGRSFIKNTLRVSVPLAVTSLVNSALLLGDRWILNYYCSTSEIGIYSLSSKFGGIFELVVVNILTIFYAPHIYESFQNNGVIKTERKNKKNFWLYILAAFCMMAGFIIVVKWVFPILIDNRYAEAERYLWIILLGEIFLGATYFKTYIINYKKKTKSILFINVVAMCFNLILNILLIPKFQIWAAASTTAASYFLMFILALCINQREFSADNN